MPYAIAVVGLGWVAQQRHIPALLRHPGLRLRGVIDRDAAKAAAIAARFGIPHHAGSVDLHGVPWLDHIDAVTIAAPPDAHCALACAALGAGKHVLTEKPFAMSEAEAVAMRTAATEAQKILAVVHNFQFARAITQLERDIRAGKLGALRWIAATQLGNPRRRLPVWYPQLPLGLFYDESPHFFYLLRRLAGELTLQDAVARGNEPGNRTPDEIRLFYQGAQKIPVTIGCNFVSPVSEWHIVVGGEKALGLVDIFRDFYLCLPQDGAHALPQIIGTSLHATLQHWAQYIPNGLAFLRKRLDYGNDEVMRRFVAAMESGQPPPDIAMTDAQAVLALQHEAIRNLRRL